ncbi:MAG: hypothetical protein FWH55_12860 [Oscillospiraceae bacterium]|nr:hypothetical protein [Oscillospiraceae bacterium]
MLKSTMREERYVRLCGNMKHGRNTLHSAGETPAFPGRRDACAPMSGRRDACAPMSCRRDACAPMSCRRDARAPKYADYARHEKKIQKNKKFISKLLTADGVLI